MRWMYTLCRPYGDLLFVIHVFSSMNVLPTFVIMLFNLRNGKMYCFMAWKLSLFLFIFCLYRTIFVEIIHLLTQCDDMFVKEWNAHEMYIEWKNVVNEGLKCGVPKWCFPKWIASCETQTPQRQQCIGAWWFSVVLGQHWFSLSSQITSRRG